MADNSSLPTATGNETFANDDISGVKWPRVKICWGVDGVAVDANATNPFPTHDQSVVDAIVNGAAASVPAGENFAMHVGGVSAIAAANFNRPADTTAYAIGDLVANSTTAGSVTPMSLTVARVNAGTGMIRRGRLTKSGTTTTLATFRAHLYRLSPTPANGDNVTLSTNQALSYIGSMDFDMTGANARAFTDGVKCLSVPNVGTEIIFDTATGTQTIFALLEARAAYVPASAETFTLALEVLQD